jgi:hypothetical protein
MNRRPDYPIPIPDVDDARSRPQRAAQEQPNNYVRAESSEEAYKRAYPQFYKPLPRRLARRRLIREGL